MLAYRARLVWYCARCQRDRTGGNASWRDPHRGDRRDIGQSIFQNRLCLRRQPDWIDLHAWKAVSSRHELTDASLHACHGKQAHIVDHVRLPLDYLAEKARSKEIETESGIEVQGNPFRPQDFVAWRDVGDKKRLGGTLGRAGKSMKLTFVMTPASENGHE